MTATNQVHFTMQGKGGVGKSLITAVYTQYLRDKHGEVKCYDTDPVNDTFRQYKALGAQRVEIMTQDQVINPRAFDGLMEQLLGHDGISIVDNGASTFVPLMAYMVENGAVGLLQDSGKKVFIHAVLTGGQGLEDTWKGLAAMLDNHPAPVVVWLNEYFGDPRHGGKDFTESALYTKNKERIAGVVRFEARNPDTYGQDVLEMARQKLTFDEALRSEAFGIMPRQRLKTVRSALFQQLDAIGF